MSLAAYQHARASAESPRATEYRLIGEITAEMIEARDQALTGAALMAPLHRNREMWSTFAADCGSAGNGLPPQLRAGIVSLALWVDRFTSDVATGREAIDALIDVNRELLEGLAPARLAA